MEGGYKALAKLRDSGAIRAIGAGINEWEVAETLARAGDFDVFLLAGRYTLLEQEALQSFLPYCVDKKIGVVIGGPFNSGILATGPKRGARYDYRPAPPAVLERVRRIETICKAHGVKLAEAALRFPLSHPAIVSVIPGGQKPGEVRRNAAMLERPNTSGDVASAEGRRPFARRRADSTLKEPTMLKSIDPLLGPDLLYVLRAMGHGDELAIVDANYPAYSAGPDVIRLDADATRTLDAVLSVLPLDTFVPEACWRMQVVGHPNQEEPIFAEFRAIIAKPRGAAVQARRHRALRLLRTRQAQLRASCRPPSAGSTATSSSRRA